MHRQKQIRTDVIAPLRAERTASRTDTFQVVRNNTIRRLTPIECERLQSFPDFWTAYGLDHQNRLTRLSETQRYKMLGNAVTVNVVEFLGQNLSRVIPS